MKKECRFCQCELTVGKAFQIVEPDKTTTYFCTECAQDMINYLNSGEAERKRMSDIGNAYDYTSYGGVSGITGVVPVSPPISSSFLPVAYISSGKIGKPNKNNDLIDAIEAAASTFKVLTAAGATSSKGPITTSDGSISAKVEEFD